MKRDMLLSHINSLALCSVAVVDRFFGHKFQRRKKKDASISG